MDGAPHWRRLERMFDSAPINRFFAARLRVGDGVASIEMPVVPAMHHAAAAAHGVVYFKVLDDAAWFAVASRIADELILTTSFSVDLVRAVGAGPVHAEGRLVHESRRVLLGQSTVRDADGRLLALGHGSFTRTGRGLDDLAPAQSSSRT